MAKRDVVESIQKEAGAAAVTVGGAQRSLAGAAAGVVVLAVGGPGPLPRWILRGLGGEDPGASFRRVVAGGLRRYREGLAQDVPKRRALQARRRDGVPFAPDLALLCRRIPTGRLLPVNELRVRPYTARVWDRRGEVFLGDERNTDGVAPACPRPQSRGGVHVSGNPIVVHQTILSDGVLENIVHGTGQFAARDALAHTVDLVAHDRLVHDAVCVVFRARTDAEGLGQRAFRGPLQHILCGT